MKTLPRFSKVLALAAAAMAILLPATARSDVINVARNGTAYANRPTYAGWSPSRLIDGDLSATLHADSNPGVGLAFTLDLGKDYPVNQIKVWPRQDGCCPERLSNFRVSVHADPTTGCRCTGMTTVCWAKWCGRPTSTPMEATRVRPRVPRMKSPRPSAFRPWPQADFFTDGTFPPTTAGSTVEITPNLDPQGQFQGQWIRILSLEDPLQSYALQLNEIEAFGTPVGGVRLMIAQQPLGVSVGVGVSATLTVNASAPGGDPVLITYQWQRAGVNVDGATQASYTTPPQTYSDDGKKYRCIVGYPGLASQTTDEATVRVNLAFRAAATSNRPLWGGRSASQLTDGNRTGLGGNVIHGDTAIEAGFAYEMNLGAEIQISQIVVWARQDGADPERLSNYRLSVHQDNAGQIGDEVWRADFHTDESNPGSTLGSIDEAVDSLDPTGTSVGQWIRILSLDDPVPDYALQMTEVEVYGLPTVLPTPSLSLMRNGASLTITYSGGTLESTDTLGMGWSAVAGASSPHAVTAEGAQRFYRVKQ